MAPLGGGGVQKERGGGERGDSRRRERCRHQRTGTVPLNFASNGKQTCCGRGGGGGGGVEGVGVGGREEKVRVLKSKKTERPFVLFSLKSDKTNVVEKSAEDLNKMKLNGTGR